MDRLSSLDASFLHVESASAHMHVGWMATAELPAGAEALDVAAVRAQLEARLHLVPRFRQLIRSPAPGLGPPTWVDAPAFELDEHLLVDPRARVDSRQLSRLADEFFSEQLPRDRPLWKIHLVPRTGGRRAALLGKVHHAMVDGIAAVQLGLLLFDVDPAAVAGDAPPWAPRVASPVRMAVDGVRDSAVDQLRVARQAAQLGLSPGRGIRIAQTLRRAAFTVADDFRHPAPDSHLNVPISGRRKLVGTRLPLTRLNAVKEASGTKLNDVVLATVSGALARLAQAESREPCDLRAMVPASVRSSGGGDARGNAVSFMFVDLPVCAAPSERLELIADRMRKQKESGRVAGSHQMIGLLGLLPGPVQGRAARLAASPRLYNLTVSNVPGPPVPLYLAGARVDSILPVIPIPDEHALAIGALSYGGHLHVTGYMDPDAVPSGRGLPMMLVDAFEELDVSTRGRRAARPVALGRHPPVRRIGIVRLGGAGDPVRRYRLARLDEIAIASNGGAPPDTGAPGGVPAGPPAKSDGAAENPPA